MFHENVPPAQQLLFPDPRPLVERLGREFFLTLPEHPGVYLMRDATDSVLYVGKARNLRKRLSSYRVANPDRLRRRHLRLLREVVRVELQVCVNEAAALQREAELLRALKPRFNRAGTWAPPTRQVLWRFEPGYLLLASSEALGPGWELCGSIRAGGRWAKAALARLLWLALNPGAQVTTLPVGWSHGCMPEPTQILCAAPAGELRTALSRLSSGDVAGFCSWAENRWHACPHAAFDAAVFQEHLETLQRAMASRARVPG